VQQKKTPMKKHKAFQYFLQKHQAKSLLFVCFADSTMILTALFAKMQFLQCFFNDFGEWVYKKH